MTVFRRNMAGPEAHARVNAERDRRLDLPLLFEGNLYDNDPGSRENIAGAAQQAMKAMVMNGAQPGDVMWHPDLKPFAFRTADNRNVLMDAQTTSRLGDAAAARKGRVIFAAVALKSADVPLDFTDDRHWP